MAVTMKIAHVLVSPEMAGAQQVSYEILKSLGDEWDKFVICSVADARSVFVDRFKSIGVKIIQLESLQREIGFSDILLFRDLYRIFKSYDFDVVHTHSTKPGVVGRVSASLANIKMVVHTVHGISYHKFLPAHRRLFYYIVEMLSGYFGTHLVLVNKYYKKYYGESAFVIPNGVALDGNENQELPSNYHKPGFTLLFMGRLEQTKDPLTLLMAFKKVLDKEGVRREKINLLIAGDGSLKSECQEFCIKEGIADHVEFLGWVDNKAAVYSRANLLCLPSLHEAFGLVIVEAAKYGVPTIATNVEGIPEVISDGRTGILCDPMDVNQFTDAILSLITSRQLLDEMGGNAMERVKLKFSLEAMCSSYRKLYLEGEG